MKVYNREANGKQIKVYKDSGTEWVIRSTVTDDMYFDAKKFTMKESISFFERLTKGF